MPRAPSDRSERVKERVFRFRGVEQKIVASRPDFRVLDIGCGRGDNLRRLLRYGGQATGIEPALDRAREASLLAPTAVAVGENIPLAGDQFDMVYISHVLHHAHDVNAVLDECLRLLVPGGLLFVIETIDDSPLMRLARALQPSWDDDEVLNRFRYHDLITAFEQAGLVTLGCNIHDQMIALGLSPSVTSYTATIRACERRHSETARACFA